VSQADADARFAAAFDLQEHGRWAEAAEAYRALTQPVLTLKVAVGLGGALAELGQFEEAAHWLGLAARHRPEDPDLRRLYANVLADLGRTAEAEAELRAALDAHPDDLAVQLALGGLLLSLDRYAEGWPLLEARAALNPRAVPAVNVRYPQWRGEPLAGKSILVWLEQGFGDQIQMARFGRSLKALGAAHVTLAARPALAHLFSTAGADEVLEAPLGTTLTVRPHDYWTRYFSLPGVLGVTAETIPGQPYLAAPHDRRGAGEGFSGIGVCWRASPTGFNGGQKTVPDAAVAPLLARGAVSLHPEDTGARDFADTAAILERLDLVVSIDTSVAHLAGALGKPCWTLLPRVRCDWRWGRGRATSPWYPTMRLYRQAAAGEWDAVIARVMADLALR
jgi:tetratricopeptide (TPR) repeat protein